MMAQPNINSTCCRTETLACHPRPQFHRYYKNLVAREHLFKVGGSREMELTTCSTSVRWWHIIQRHPLFPSYFGGQHQPSLRGSTLSVHPMD